MRAPSIDFDLEKLDPRGRVDAWRSLHQDIYRVLPRNDVPAGVQASASVWNAGSLVIGRHRHSPAVGVRDARLIGRSPQDILILRMYLQGQSRALFGDEARELTPSAVHLFDFVQEHREVTTEVDGISVAIPHRALGYDRTSHPSALSFPLDTPAGRLLKPNIAALYRAAGEADADEAAMLSEAFVAMVRALIAPQLGDANDRTRFERAREVAVQDYIERRLRGPMIKADEICVALELSRSRLYRLLEPHGGLARYVIGRKLEAAMAALNASKPLPGIVGTIAERYGFADQAHFSRVFRARFGMPPREAVGLVRNGEAATRVSGGLSTTLAALYARSDAS